MAETTAAASASALPCPYGWLSSGGRAAMASPLHTMSDATTSANDSTASATSAYVFPTSPATSFAAANPALTSIPTWAARMLRRVASTIGAREERSVGSRRSFVRKLVACNDAHQRRAAHDAVAGSRHGGPSTSPNATRSAGAAVRLKLTRASVHRRPREARHVDGQQSSRRRSHVSERRLVRVTVRTLTVAPVVFTAAAHGRRARQLTRELSRDLAIIAPERIGGDAIVRRSVRVSDRGEPKHCSLGAK